MDYSFFDPLIDAVFVVDAQRGVQYCNEAAAKLCDSSVKRLCRGKPLYDTIEFSDKNLFVMPDGTLGESSATPSQELRFKLKSGKEGKVQVAITPFKEGESEKRWIVVIRDVTLEEVLHAKYHKQLEEKEVFIQQLQDAQKQLEAYSKNLEQMVEERTKEVKRANLLLRAIMDSLGQGFLVFDSQGICDDIFTKACEVVLEGVPKSQHISKLLKLEGAEKETFELWIKAVFAEQLPFETMKTLGPNTFAHSQGKHIQLEFYPIRNDQSKITNLVLVATDQTAEINANIALEKEKKYARMVLKMVSNKKQFLQFLSAVGLNIDSLIDTAKRVEVLPHEELFRALHTIEGEAGTYSIAEIWTASRKPQEVLEPLKRGESVDAVRIKGEFLFAMNELKKSLTDFLEQNSELLKMIGFGRAHRIELEVKEIETVISHLQNHGLKDEQLNFIEDSFLREPIGDLIYHFADMVNGVAAKLGKEIQPVVFQGCEEKVFLNRYQNLFSTFVHAFRNAVDHGIEAPGEREMMGKSRFGKIEVKVVRKNPPTDSVSNQSWIRVEVRDDGGGIDHEKLKSRMIEKGLISENDQISQEMMIQYVFASGVSTKDEIGEFSGRGIGLNAVKEEAEKLGGAAWVETELGKGTCLIVEIPDLPRLDRELKAA